MSILTYIDPGLLWIEDDAWENDEQAPVEAFTVTGYGGWWSGVEWAGEDW